MFRLVLRRSLCLVWVCYELFGMAWRIVSFLFFSLSSGAFLLVGPFWLRVLLGIIRFHKLCFFFPRVYLHAILLSSGFWTSGPRISLGWNGRRAGERVGG